AELLRLPRARDDVLDVEHLLRPCLGLVVARLRAVRAVLRASARLDAEERAELDLVVRVMRDMDAPRLVEQRQEGLVVQRADGLAREAGFGHRRRPYPRSRAGGSTYGITFA